MHASEKVEGAYDSMDHSAAWKFTSNSSKIILKYDNKYMI